MTMYQFDGFIETEKSKLPFNVRISKPVVSSDSDRFCVVEIHPLLESAKPIYGSDAQQATALAFSFLLTIVADRKVYDMNRQLIDFDDLLAKAQTQLKP